MREILFRGKRVDNREWIEGNLVITKSRGIYIKSQDDNKIFGCGLDVIPETVGQFTGLLDKNGKKIFEGDHFGNSQFPVAFLEGKFVLGGIPLIGYLNGEYMNQVHYVKGNIHDNPELINK